MKKVVCKRCKIFYEGDRCPICKGESVANSWQGRIVFLDVEKSFIAGKMGVSVNGEYALKVR